MAAQMPSPPDVRLSRKPEPWLGWLRLPRSPWFYGFVAMVLLIVSQLLWLWHSWPVREILDSERPFAEVTS